LREGEGFADSDGLELLDSGRILSALGAAPVTLRNLECVGDTESTNADLLARPVDDAHRVARLAERQTGGRGRRGRPWFSPYARNVYLSLGWRFDAAPDALRFLPLVVAVAVARAVTAAGFSGHGIKWPNDLVTPRGKLGGCLVELRGARDAPTLAVLGVGLNVHLAGASGLEAVDQPWDDLARKLPGVSRNETAGRLLYALLTAVQAFERDGLGVDGFSSFAPDWARFDRLAGQEVAVRGEHLSVDGRCLGLGEAGGLQVQTDDGIVELHAGDVSVRNRVS
jgi:BirA family biotin operon repressor/biotin-[acetyl-CoA-carboxylase] ligase